MTGLIINVANKRMYMLTNYKSSLDEIYFFLVHFS